MSVPAAQRIILRRSVRGIWPHLPLLLVSSVAVCAAASVGALIAPGATPVSVLALTMLVTAPMVALCAVANAVVQQDDATFTSWTRGWRVGVGRGFVAVGPAAISGTLFLVAIEVWRQADQPILLISVAISGAVTLTMLPLTGAMAQAVSALPELTVREQWRTAAALVARWPVRFLSAPILLVLGVWLATQWSVALLLLVPAPVALISAAAFWTSAVESDLLTIEASSETDTLERESA